MLTENELLKLLEPCIFKHEYTSEDGEEGEPVDAISIDNLKAIMLREQLIVSRPLDALVSQDFWRTFTRKLTKEYERICNIDYKCVKTDKEITMVKKILEPIIDALIKTEQELDNRAKNSG